MLQPEEVDNFYVATTESSGSGGSGSGAGAGGHTQGSGGPGALLYAPGSGPSSNRPHPERMPEGQPLTRTLDPVDGGVVSFSDLQLPRVLKSVLITKTKALDHAGGKRYS